MHSTYLEKIVFFIIPSAYLEKIVLFRKYFLPCGNSMRICFIKHLSRAIVCQLIFHSVIWQGKFCRQKSEFQTACQKSCDPALHTSILWGEGFAILQPHVTLTACQKICHPALHPGGTIVENTRVCIIVYFLYIHLLEYVIPTATAAPAPPKSPRLTRYPMVNTLSTG